MGLDQYLKKKIYIGAYFDHRDVKGVVDISIAGQKVPVKMERVSLIEERVGYWRKANQIHNWFVKKVQDGQDNCREYYVSVEQLKELLDDCKKVKATVIEAPEVLPTAEGFFFGSQEYDDSYWADIDLTIEIIENILKEEAEGTNGDYYYSSSW